MNIFRFFIIIVFANLFELIFTQNVQCPSGWTQLNELCYRVFTVNVNQGEAQLRCANEARSGTLAHIHSQAVQNFLNNLIYKIGKIGSNVWIGAIRSHVGYDEFKWNDDSEMVYTNWDRISPTCGHDKDCVVLQPLNTAQKVSADGKWRDVKCAQKNYFVCQRRLMEEPTTEPPETEAPVTEPPVTEPPIFGCSCEIAEKLDKALKEKVNERKMRLEEVTKKIDDLTTDIIAVPLPPVGFIYTQFDSQLAPDALWSGAMWEDISSEYRGLFFRAEGETSGSFGIVQEESCTKLVAVKSIVMKDANVQDNVTVVPGQMTPYIYTGGTVGESMGLRFKPGEEVRPRNTAIKIWKRIG